MKHLVLTTALVTALAGTANAEEVAPDPMLALTQSVLQGITGDAPETAEASADQPDLSELVTQAMQAGQSDAYLEALVAEAVNRGEVEVSDAMIDTEGEVDTKTLLASLVSKSLDANASEQSDLVAEANGGLPKAGSEPSQPIRHTVAEGESLAAIALAYYRDAQLYNKIYEANRDVIPRPNLIRVGQEILIP